MLISKRCKLSESSRQPDSSRMIALTWRLRAELCIQSLDLDIDVIKLALHLSPNLCLFLQEKM